MNEAASKWDLRQPRRSHRKKKKKSKKQQKSFGAVKTIQLPKSKFLVKFVLDKEKKKENIHHFRSSRG